MIDETVEIYYSSQHFEMSMAYKVFFFFFWTGWKLVLWPDRVSKGKKCEDHRSMQHRHKEHASSPNNS